MKSIRPNYSLGKKTCYSRYCNSIWASFCNYCFVTFSMCIIRRISLHKLQHSTRKTCVNNILGERNMYSKFRIFNSRYYLSKFNLSCLCFGVFCALSAFFSLELSKNWAKTHTSFSSIKEECKSRISSIVWVVYSNSSIQVFVVYSSDLSKLKQSCTISICAPATGKQSPFPECCTVTYIHFAYKTSLTQI